MAGFRVDVYGTARAQVNMRRTADMTVDRVAKGLYMEAERIMAMAKEEFVPVKTGTLRSTGHVKAPRIENGRIVVELAFGGPAAPYAVVVHERPMKHSWSPTASGKPGTNKYLEAPLRLAAPGLPARLAAWVDFLKASGQ